MFALFRYAPIAVIDVREARLLKRKTLCSTALGLFIIVLSEFQLLVHTGDKGSATMPNLIILLFGIYCGIAFQLVRAAFGKVPDGRAGGLGPGE